MFRRRQFRSRRQAPAVNRNRASPTPRAHRALGLVSLARLDSRARDLANPSSLAIFSFFCRALFREWPVGIVRISIAWRTLLHEGAHALLAVFSSGNFEHGVQLLLITFIGAVPVPIHFDQPLGLAHG